MFMFGLEAEAVTQFEQEILQVIQQCFFKAVFVDNVFCA